MQLPRFYAILDPSVRPEIPQLTLAQQLIDAGVRLIQLRSKEASSRDFLSQAVDLVRLARKHKVRIIINDRADVAWLSKAQGVHVGQTDLSVRQVRKILGPRKIVGISTHNEQQALAAQRTTASYLAYGPIFPTSTKSQPDRVVGLDGLRRIRTMVSKPLVAIGGITLENALEVIEAGADAVAVIADVLKAPDVMKRASEFIRILEKGSHQRFLAGMT